jgi:hypothetical protein
VRRILCTVLILLMTPLFFVTSVAGAARPHHAITLPRVHRVRMRELAVESVARLRHDAASVGFSITVLQAKWQRVAWCEVGGNWSMVGSIYSGIGFLNSTWNEFGGRQYARLAGLASRDEQIVIGMRVTHGWVPDQGGCAVGGW